MASRVCRAQERSSVFLIGYRGSGKSSVGRLLAEKLGCAFSDTDRMVEEAIGSSISEYFRQAGEPAFRARESEALAEIAGAAAAGSRRVAATGGGIVLNLANIEAMRRAGVVVWLVASAATLRQRILADAASAASRPALQGSSSADEVEAVLRQREPLYRAAADFEVLTEGRGAEEIAGEILRRIEILFRP